MLDARFVRENAEAVKENTAQRNMDSAVVDKWLETDKQRKQLIGKIEEIRQAKNAGTKDMADEDRQKVVQLKAGLQEFESKLDKVNATWTVLLNQIPNMNGPDVPIGKTEEDNITLSKYREPTIFNFPAKDHVEITVNRGLIDFERGSKVAGSQFYYLQGDMVVLEMAVIQFVLALAIKKGYTPLHTPDLARSRYYLGTGFNPRGDEAQTYEIKDEDLGLIATSEVTTAGYHADEIIDVAKLPLKYISLSHCFRKEAGAYGKYSKGLYRVHQFTKLEMFVYCKPEDSVNFHEEILEIEKEIMEQLGIPYRVLNICSGDMGAMAVKKYDVEAWMPGRNDYGEVTSASNCGDYQSRNLNIRYRDKDGTHFVDMLNGTASALSRTLIAIIENYQQSDGSINVPTVLQKYMIGEKKTI
jgi:seryl-tRNA synthetase